MIIYNVTVKVEKEIHEEWLQWMKEIHIPEVLKTGLFIENRIFKVHIPPFAQGLAVEEESDGITYAVQYTCENISHYNKYQSEFAPLFQKEHNNRYGEKALAFRTLLEAV